MNKAPLTFFERDVWEVFVKPGEVMEVRFVKAIGKLPLTREHVKGATISGYFDGHTEFCTHIKEALETLTFEGCYFTLQVIDPRLLARAFNRLKISRLATSDHNVLAYRWLPLDFDPVRPAGISSSDMELNDALELRDRAATWIVENLGFTLPVRAMSGNGGHLLFRLPDLPVNQGNINFVRNVLAGLADRFDTESVKIDRAVFNPGRIWKLYGSSACKGDVLPKGPGRDARPHRKAYIEVLGA